MVAPVGRSAYLGQLHALMPRGRAWPHHRGAVLSQLLDAIAAQFAGVDEHGAALLDDQLASRTIDLLPEWETDVGLPDDCSSLASSIALRRAAVVSKLIAQPDLSPSSYISIGRTFGIDILVEHLDQTRAGLIPNLDTSGGKWRFVWWITIPTSADIVRFNMLSDFNTPFRSVARNTELECRLQKASPAHTMLYISYVSATVSNRVSIPLPAHDEFQTDRLRWQNNVDGLGDVSSLLAVAGTDALSRFQLSGNGVDADNNCQLRTLNGAELNTVFEGYASAITVQVPGLTDLVMAGPGSSLHATPDAGEPYQFIPGGDYTNGAISYLYSVNDQPAGLAAWVEDFKAAYAADNTLRAVLTLYDGQ